MGIVSPHTASRAQSIPVAVSTPYLVLAQEPVVFCRALRRKLGSSAGGDSLRFLVDFLKPARPKGRPVTWAFSWAYRQTTVQGMNLQVLFTQPLSDKNAHAKRKQTQGLPSC